MKNVLFLFMIMKSCLPRCFHIQFLKTRHDAKWGVREGICALMLMMMMLFFLHVLHGKWPEICLHCLAYLQFTSNSSVVTTSKMGWLKANFSHHHDHSQFSSAAHSHCDFDCDNEVIIWNIVLCVHRERDRMVNLKWKWASPLCSLFMRNEKSCENIHFPLNFPSEECSACFLCMLFQLLSFLANSQNTPLFAPQFYPFSTSSELLSGHDDV